MHSGDRLFGKLCRCMHCAEQRARRVQRESRRRYPEEFQELIEAEDHVADLQVEMARARETVRNTRVSLWNKTMSALAEDMPDG